LFADELHRCADFLVADSQIRHLQSTPASLLLGDGKALRDSHDPSRRRLQLRAVAYSSDPTPQLRDHLNIVQVPDALQTLAS
jgi:hypothetical protein